MKSSYTDVLMLVSFFLNMQYLNADNNEIIFKADLVQETDTKIPSLKPDTYISISNASEKSGSQAVSK